MTPHPLIERLLQQAACPAITTADLDLLLAQPGNMVLFCGGDPVQYPECLDVAVVLPQLQAAFPGRFRVAVASHELEPAMQTRYGFQRWPSLVILRDGQYVGTIQGMQDWSDYLQRMAELLDAPVTRAPSIGIALASATPSHCH